jgi:hypothetical protein
MLLARATAELAHAFPDTTSAQRDRWRHALVAVVTRRRPDGPQTSSTGISLEEQLDLSNLITRIGGGAATITDGPDQTVELHAGGGWRYTITLDPPAVTVTRGQGENTDTGNAEAPVPATGEAPASDSQPEASPDQLSLDNEPA